MLIDNGYTKSILRESMRGILQENIRTDRVKKGFNCSIKTLIDFNDKDIIEFYLNQNQKYLILLILMNLKLFYEDLTKNHFSKFIFVFLSTKLFLEQANK